MGPMTTLIKAAFCPGASALGAIGPTLRQIDNSA
jgi:hypothetical protein